MFATRHAKPNFIEFFRRKNVIFSFLLYTYNCFLIEENCLLLSMQSHNKFDTSYTQIVLISKFPNCKLLFILKLKLRYNLILSATILMLRKNRGRGCSVLLVSINCNQVKFYETDCIQNTNTFIPKMSFECNTELE